MSAVADASPLIALARVGLLDLLPQIYGSVLVSPAVRQEALEGRPHAADAATIQEAFDSGVIQAAEVQPARILHELGEEVDSGEAEAIALAIEVVADVVILDEKKARSVARRMGLRVTGTAGVLGTARNRGLIPAAAPLLERLRAEGFRLSSRLVEETRSEEEPGS